MSQNNRTHHRINIPRLAVQHRSKQEHSSLAVDRALNARFMFRSYLSVVHTAWFKRDLRAVCDRDITIHGLIAVWDFKPHLKFERIASSSSIFEHFWSCSEDFSIFRDCRTTLLPCRVWTNHGNYSHRFVAVIARQLQLQPLSNHRVNDTLCTTICLKVVRWTPVKISEIQKPVFEIWKRYSSESECEASFSK